MDIGTRSFRSRADWEALADRALAAVRPYATPGHALIHLPGPQSRSGQWSDGLEGFARTFLLAGFRLAQSRGRDPGGVAEWYAAGLAAGTDPDSPERWPRPDEIGQAKVECASIALALHESRPWIWDRLDGRVRANLVDWMGAMVGTETPDNNWTWFRAVTEAFLRSVGGPWRREDLEHTFARTEAWYVGDGWYSDGEAAPGEPRCFDYYSGWAMHFYPLWYCRISGDDAEPGLLDRYRERLRRYLEDAERLVGVDCSGGGGGGGGGNGGNGGSDGDDLARPVRPLFQGRSLTYRFAMLAPFWAGAIFDSTPLPPGRTRRLAGGVLEHFVGRGCFDEAGLLPIGWHRRFETMREPYSGGGSPYWASKGFAGLVLPEDHPVWTAPEEPLPIESGDVSFALPRLGWIASGTKADGVVRIAQHGGDHAATTHLGIDVPGYALHGYSTHAAPNYGEWAAIDSHIALLTENGGTSHRTPALSVHIDEGQAVSRHRAHWWLGKRPLPNDPHQPQLSQDTEFGFTAGPWVTTASLLHGPLEIRLARVDPAGPGSPDELGGEWPTQAGPWKLRFGGWALAVDEGTAPSVRSAVKSAWAEGLDGLTTTIVGLRGPFTAGCYKSGGMNPLAYWSAVPIVETLEPIEYGEVYAVLVALSGTVAGPQAAHGVTLGVESEGGASRVSVTWPDGRRDDVLLPATPNG